MIKPSVARMMWYNPHPREAIYTPSQVLAAILCSVIDDNTVNLAVFGADGSGPYARQNVPIFDGETAPHPPGSAVWMPFQKGQAANTEALEAAAGHTSQSPGHVAEPTR